MDETAKHFTQFSMPLQHICSGTRRVCIYICSAQSKNRYNSGIVLRKVRIPTLSADSGIVPDNSRIAQGGIYRIIIRYTLCAK